MNFVTFKIWLNETLDKKFIVNKKSFNLFLENKLVSKAGYNIESPDEWFNENYITLFNVKTLEKFQGKGLAKYLLQEIFKYVKNELNINIIALIVYKDNDRALNLYFNNGFIKYMEYDDSYSLIKKL